MLTSRVLIQQEHSYDIRFVFVNKKKNLLDIVMVGVPPNGGIQF